MPSNRSQAELAPDGAPHKTRWGRRLAIFAIVVVLLGAGGWWLYQSGLLASLLPQTSQSATTGNWPGAAGAVTQFQGTTASTARQRSAAAAINASADAGADSAVGAAASTTAGTPENAAAATGGVAPASLTQSTEAATAPVTLPAVASVAGVQLRGDDGAVLATLDPGAVLTAKGRAADGVWLAVDSPAGAGWVQTAQVLAYGLHKLPEVEAPAAVTAPVIVLVTPTPAPAATNDVVAVNADAAEAGVTDIAAADIAAANAAAADGVVVEAGAAAARTLAKVITDDARLNVRAGPGTDYRIVGKATSGAQYAVLGRNQAGDWLLVQLSDDAADTGWVAAEFVQLDGDARALPVTAAAATAPAIEISSVAGVVVSTEAASTGTATAAPVSVAQAGAAAGGTDLQGTLVFQQSPGGMIYAYDLETGALRELTHGFDPAISPDGATVAFVRDGGEAGLYLIGSDGSDERLIFGERGQLSSPKWSPDGQWLVFSRNDEYVECYDMGFNRCVTQDELDEMLKRMPQDAPGGSTTDFPLVKQYQHQLSAVDVNGANFHDIVALDSALAPDWNEGGIVYQSKAGLQRTADVPGAVNQLVAFDYLKPFYYDPDWQPGGGQIAFQVKGASQWEIYVINPDGTGMTALTRPVTTLVDELPSNVAPAYSPDGQHIVFVSNRGADNSAGAWRLWVMDADGSNQRQLPIGVEIDYTFGLEQVVSWGM